MLPLGGDAAIFTPVVGKSHHLGSDHHPSSSVSASATSFSSQSQSQRLSQRLSQSRQDRSGIGEDIFSTPTLVGRRVAEGPPSQSATPTEVSRSHREEVRPSRPKDIPPPTVQSAPPVSLSSPSAPDEEDALPVLSPIQKRQQQHSLTPGQSEREPPSPTTTPQRSLTPPREAEEEDASTNAPAPAHSHSRSHADKAEEEQKMTVAASYAGHALQGAMEEMMQQLQVSLHGDLQKLQVETLRELHQSQRQTQKMLQTCLDQQQLILAELNTWRREKHSTVGEGQWYGEGISWGSQRP